MKTDTANAWLEEDNILSPREKIRLCRDMKALGRKIHACESAVFLFSSVLCHNLLDSLLFYQSRPDYLKSMDDIREGNIFLCLFD